MTGGWRASGRKPDVEALKPRRAYAATPALFHCAQVDLISGTARAVALLPQVSQLRNGVRFIARPAPLHARAAAEHQTVRRRFHAREMQHLLKRLQRRGGPSRS